MEENIQEESGLSLIDLINIFKKNLLIIVVCIILFIILGFVYVLGIYKPTYKSTAVVMVQVLESGNVNDGTDVTTGLRIVNTVAEFMKSDSIIDEVSDRVGVNSKLIASNTSVNFATTSLNITITYTSKNEEEVCDVINTIIAVSQQRANSVYKNSDNKEEYIYPTIAKTISVVSDATKTSTTGMGRTVLLVIFTMIGGIIGIVAALMKELLNNTVRDVEEIEKSLKVKVIGVIPSYSIKGRNRYV